MKERLLLISDLWGFNNCDWIQLYIDKLVSDFDLTLFDCHIQSEIPHSLTSEKEIHQYFTTDGIKICTEKLRNCITKKTSVLAFSIGGTIAWKTALKNIQFNTLYTVSSTRLRLENKRPSGNIRLFYGTEDNYRPSDAWFKQNNISYTLFQGKKHNLYMKSDSCESICSSLINENKLVTI